MKTTVGIVAHEHRRRMWEELHEKVRSDFVVVDYGGIGTPENHIRAWEEFDGVETEWGILLEDDAKPVANFRAEVGKMLAAAPTSIVSLYLGRQRPPHWQQSIAQVILSGKHFTLSDTLLNCVGVAVHRDYIPDLSSWLRKHYEVQKDKSLDNQLPIDELITKFAQEMGLFVSYSIPSLIDHADTETLLKYHFSQYKDRHMSVRTKGRTAWSVGTRDKWNQSYIKLPAPGEWVDS